MFYIRSNIVNLAKSGQYKYVLHGCNCFCTMGAGVAKALSSQWPGILEADRATPYGDKGKLGGFSVAHISGMNGDFYVYNLYTQYKYGTANLKNFKIEYLKKALLAFDKDAKDLNGKVLMPPIGCGHGGGDWREVYSVIKETIGHRDVSIVSLQGGYKDIEDNYIAYRRN